MARLSNFFADSIGDVTVANVTDPRELPVQVGVPYIKDWTNAHDRGDSTNFWYRSIPTYLQMFNDEWASVYTAQTWNNPNPTQAGVTPVYYKATTASEILGGYLVYTDVNNYSTVCDLTGTGWLTNVIGLANHGQASGCRTYIRITVDGNEYEFKSFLDYRNDGTTSDDERLVWGLTTYGANSTSSPHSGGPWANGYGDYGTGRENRTRFLKYDKDTMILSSGEQYFTIPNPYTFNSFRGFIGLRFESTIKVEVKNEPVSGASLSTSAFSDHAAAFIKRDIITS